MAKYLVTGCAGFIGSWIAEELLRRGEPVRGLDNFETGHEKNLQAVCRSGSLDFRKVDLRDAAGAAEACRDVEIIFHQAALPSVPLSIQDPRTSHTANIDSTFNLLEGARAAGVRRVVYAASSSAYGNQTRLPQVEAMPTQPISPYAVQKLTGELYMRSYWEVYGLETVALRYFNIFGPRQAPDSPYSGVIAKWALSMLQGDTVRVNGDGEQGRDFTYVENVVSANLQAAEAPAERVAGRMFNIACGERHTLNETFRVMAGLLGYEKKAEYGPERAGDIRDSMADIGAAREGFGYKPMVGFEEGLRRTMEWYREAYAGTA